MRTSILRYGDLCDAQTGPLYNTLVRMDGFDMRALGQIQAVKWGQQINNTSTQ